MDKIDWLKVEEAMRRSIRGHASDTDFQYCQDAYKCDSKKYSELSRRVRKEEQDEYRRSGGIN